MNKEKTRQLKRQKRKARTNIKGDQNRPRLSVYKSIKHIYAQVIDDSKGITLAAASDFDIKDKKLKKTEIAFEVGKLIAQKCKEKEISSVIFDKGSFKYHGRVKAVADGSREEGMTF